MSSTLENTLQLFGKNKSDLNFGFENTLYESDFGNIFAKSCPSVRYENHCSNSPTFLKFDTHEKNSATFIQNLQSQTPFNISGKKTQNPSEF